jgi:hypothetical protein
MNHSLFTDSNLLTTAALNQTVSCSYLLTRYLRNNLTSITGTDFQICLLEWAKDKSELHTRRGENLESHIGTDCFIFPPREALLKLNSHHSSEHDRPDVVVLLKKNSENNFFRQRFPADAKVIRIHFRLSVQTTIFESLNKQENV